MPPEQIDPALTTFVVGTMILSIVACINVVRMHYSGEVLPYEHRRPVPWGLVGGILAMTYMVIAVCAASISGSGGDGDASLHSLDPAALIVSMIGQLFVVGGFLFVIWVFTTPTLRDFGLPTNLKQCLRDVCVGAAACLAALAPVLMLQQSLMHLFFREHTESGHPLIKMVMDAPPNPWILVLAGVAAVVVAPICEEIAFRLLLQGWLERWEDARLGWRKKPAIEVPNESAAATEGKATVTDDELVQPVDSRPDVSESIVESDPPRRGVAGLPYGWFPIVVSATVFGLAHFGYGPEPVPLFLLALVLGFLYQRTHRVLPGIVAHALFNLFTMIILWRMVYHHG